MPNRRAHLIGGTVGLILVYLLLDKLGLAHYISYGITVFVGSVMPDILDPPTSCWHRQFFHCKRVLKYMFYSLPVTILIALLWHPMLYVTFFALGYIIHLLMDKQTTAGLPP